MTTSKANNGYHDSTDNGLECSDIIDNGVMSQKFSMGNNLQYMLCNHYKDVVHRAANDNQPILFSKIARHMC